MKETCEFRVVEEFAPKLFTAAEGKRLGDSVRQVEVATNDPRFHAIGMLQREIREKTDRSFYYGWILRRRYSKAEMDEAAIFKLKVTSTFEPAGEECGTMYDETLACVHCGAGARQLTPLYLPEKRIPKTKDVSRTIAGEIVVSWRLKDLFERHGITGAEFSPVRSNPKLSAESKDWFQFNVSNACAEIAAPTRVGIDPFDDDAKGEYRCPQGDIIGLNILSEVYVDSTSRGDDDIICTRQFVGMRGGLLRPERIILVSPKVRRLIDFEKLRGVEIEVAQLV